MRRRFWLTWRGFFVRLYQRYAEHGVADSTSALGYYFVFALVPFLFFLATLTAFIPHVRASVDTVLERARVFLPAEAMAIVEPYLRGPAPERAADTGHGPS
jgi:membrane protein